MSYLSTSELNMSLKHWRPLLDNAGNALAPINRRVSDAVLHRQSSFGSLLTAGTDHD
ncbi:MAG: hypothetical protein ACI81O_001600 [Cyclobacteriaceae bacterium]|jgi:hypothetical protein